MATALQGTPKLWVSASQNPEPVELTCCSVKLGLEQAHSTPSLPGPGCPSHAHQVKGLSSSGWAMLVNSTVQLDQSSLPGPAFCMPTDTALPTPGRTGTEPDTWGLYPVPWQGQGAGTNHATPLPPPGPGPAPLGHASKSQHIPHTGALRGAQLQLDMTARANGVRPSPLRGQAGLAPLCLHQCPQPSPDLPWPQPHVSETSHMYPEFSIARVWHMAPRADLAPALTTMLCGSSGTDSTDSLSTMYLHHGRLGFQLPLHTADSPLSSSGHHSLAP